MSARGNLEHFRENRFYFYGVWQITYSGKLQRTNVQHVAFEVLVAVNITVLDFWGVMLCTLINKYERFLQVSCRYHESRRVDFASSSIMKKNKGGSSETLVAIYCIKLQRH
jgi:hypothetical protein